MIGTNVKMREFFDKLAPRWDDYSNANSELILRYINLLDIKAQDKILDVACGTGVVTECLLGCEPCEIHAVDISEKMIEVAKSKINSPKVTFYIEDFLSGGFGGFDCLIMYNALPHFIVRKKLLRSLSKAVKKGGKVLICHGSSKSKINSCHKRVMDISSKLQTPKDEYSNFAKEFKLIDCKDSASEYYLLLEKI